MNIFNRIMEFITPVKALPEGMYHLQSPVEDEKPFRLHLRLQKGGSGILILNASTVLHLNPTAAEYAFHLIKGSKPEDAAKEISARYRISKTQARLDYDEFVESIHALVHRADLDPVTVLGFERVQPNSASLSAPLRLDCALTYQLTGGVDPAFAPIKRVERELTTEEWLDVIDKAWAAGIPQIVFTGGEPTLRDDLTLFIAQAEKNGQVAGLISDGVKLAVKGYFESLLQTGLDHLMIVLPIEGEVDWKTLREVVEADIFLAVHLTITPGNSETAPELIDSLHKAGVENISLSVSDLGLQDQVLKLRDLAVEKSMRIVFDLPVPYSDANPFALEVTYEAGQAGAGKAWMYVEPDGDVIPAQGFANQIRGNILKDGWEKLYSG